MANIFRVDSKYVHLVDRPKPTLSSLSLSLSHIHTHPCWFSRSRSLPLPPPVSSPQGTNAIEWLLHSQDMNIQIGHLLCSESITFRLHYTDRDTAKYITHLIRTHYWTFSFRVSIILLLFLLSSVLNNSCHLWKMSGPIADFETPVLRFPKKITCRNYARLRSGHRYVVAGVFWDWVVTRWFLCHQEEIKWKEPTWKPDILVTRHGTGLILSCVSRVWSLKSNTKFTWNLREELLGHTSPVLTIN